MRSLAIDSREFRLLTTPRPQNAIVSGKPVATSWFTGESGPDGLPVWRTQMVDPAPVGGWSWGALPGYYMPALPVGQRIRIYWYMRGNSNGATSITISKDNGTEQTTVGYIAEPTKWARTLFDVVLAYASTNSHRIRRPLRSEPGVWVEMTPPVIEIVSG